MKARRSLISRIASVFRRKKTSEKTRKPVKDPKNKGIEALEGRIAPATLIDGSTVQYTEADGDVITIKFSKELFNKLPSAEDTITQNNLDDIFKFSSGSFITEGSQDLQRIDLTKLKSVGGANPANGISFTIESVTTAEPGRDGLAKIGAINASGISLGDVSIEGDLGQIDVGVASSKIAIKSLTVNSLFANGYASQPGTVIPTDALESKIVGGVKLLHVKGDLEGYFHVVDGNSIVGNSIKTTAPGNVTKVIIEGSLRGDPDLLGTSDNTGSINVQGTIGNVEVLGGLVGGGGKNSGSIIAAKKIGTIFVNNSVTGGGGLNSGAIIGASSVSKVIVGDLVGGAGTSSGIIQGLSLKQISVVDSITGGVGDNSGTVISPGLLSNISVKEIIGGNGKSSGGIRVDDLGKATISGSITGGAGIDSGVILADNGINSIVVNQNIVGGTGVGSGGVLTNGLLKSIVVNGGITGGTVENTGYIGSQSKIDTVKVVGALTGGVGAQSARIFSAGSIDNVSVLKLVGGDGEGSGSILAASDPAIGGTIKSANVALGLEGGLGDSSGTILSLADIGKVTIGSRLQATGLSGGEGKFSGSIIAAGSIGKLKGKPSGVLVYGSVTGGEGDRSGMIHASENAGLIEIRGGLTGQDGDSGEVSGIVRVDGQLKSLVVDGGLNNASVLVGADLVKAVIGTGMTDSTISAFGATDPSIKSGDIAIGSLTVDGAVAGSQILAGYDQDGNGLNADASIKFVQVTGNWTASDLVAGALANDGLFGNADDTRINAGIDRDGFVATIARIQILGSIAGSAETGDHFGFVAEQIAAFQAGGANLPLTTAPGQVIEISGTDDVTVREVTA